MLFLLPLTADKPPVPAAKKGGAKRKSDDTGAAAAAAATHAPHLSPLASAFPSSVVLFRLAPDATPVRDVDAAADDS